MVVWLWIATLWLAMTVMVATFIVFVSEKAWDAFARPCQLFCKKSDKVYSPC